MSKISLQPNASGAGTFTLAAPDSNTNRTLTLPDETGTVATIENIPPGYEDQDALDLFNVTGSAPVYACRAWVFFNGTGTVSINGSGNVSSITDNGTGQYTVNLATAMPDLDFCVNTTGTGGLTNSGYVQLDSTSFGGGGSTTTYPSTNSVNLRGVDFGGSQRDHPMVCVSIFR